MIRSDYTLHNSSNATEIQSQSTVIASASAQMLENSTGFANGDYLIGLFNTLTQRETPITVMPKTLAGQGLNLDVATSDRLGMVFCYAIPALTLGLGMVVWLKRRNR